MANIKDTTFDGSSDFVSDDLYTGGGENAAANGTVPNKTKSAVMLKVNFCVIVPSNFIESPSTELQIQFEGKINRKEKETSRIQNVEGAFFVTFHVLFSEEEISEQVSYYYMSVTDKQCAVKDKHQNEVKKRNITFEKKSLSEEVWWQYDGVLNLIDSTFFERVFFSAESEVRTSVRHFFPKWKYFYSHCSLDEPASLIMKRISMLYQGLLKNYYTAGKKWKNEKQFKEFIGKLFLDELKRTLEELIEFPQILHATAIILLDKEFNIPFHETQQNGLMRCLVLDVQKEEKKSQKYNDLINHFCDVLQDIPKALLCFIKSEKMASNSMWLCCLPLLHFLSGKCQPFDDITENADHSSRQPHWWGIEDVQDKVSKLKSSTWNIRAESLLDKLKPMFPMDFYLPRSFVAVLDYKDFDVLRSKKINPEVLLAGLIFHFKTGEIDRIKGQKTMLSKELLITVEEQLIEYSGHSNIPSQNLLESCYLTMKIAEDLLSVVLVRRDNSLKARAVKTLVTALAVYETVLGQKEKTTKSKEHIKILSGNTGHILNWLKEFQTSRNDKETLQTWDILFQKELPAGSVKSTVQSLLKEQIKDFLEEKLPFKKKNIVDIYLDGPQIFSAFMREILDDFVSKVLETNIDLFKGTHRNEIYKLLLKQFEDKWRKLNATKDQLELMLTWKPFPYCFGVYCEKRKAKEPSLDAAAEVLKRLYKELQNAEIRVWTLNLLQTYEDEACNLIRNLLNSVDINFTELLTSRKNELRAFDEIKRRTGLFIDLCQHFEVDLSTLETKMNAVVSEKIQEKKIRELCVFSGQAPQSVQVAFDVPQLLIAILSDIEKACKGNVFMKKWIRMGKEKAVSKGKPLTMEEAISTFHKVQKECKEISEKIISGYITFSEFEDLFGSFENEKDILREQLENLCYHTIYPGLIKERMDQFQQYRIIERCRAGADVLLRIRQDFHLKGNFHQIEEIAFMVRSGKVKQMRELDRSLITSCRILEDITDEKLESLEKFVNCKELINWIKRHIKGNTELDSFLQLAYVEAGEGDADKSKVYCLRDAIIGYQHLIFNLQTNSDYAWLLKLCEELWKEIKTDKDLPEKLCFAKRHLEWYASVNEKQQRSVQSTTLEQVTNINSSGVYYVGKIMETDQRRTPTLEQVLELRVRHGDTQKTYRYSDLQDLQSKLMLVTGEESSQSDAVQKFTNVFEAVVRLSKLYIRLLSSGCVLFDIWKSRFLCDPERQACVFVQFGKCEFKGKTSPSEDVSTIIPRLCSYMESCLDQWIKYVDEKRCKYHELNSFTIGQIVIMQREIAKFDSNKHSKDLYQLLSITKQDCSRCNIFEALREVLFEIDQTEVKSPYDEKKERIEEEPKAVREESKETSFLTSMKNEGISETLARAALRSGISTDDINEGLAWCAMNADKAVKIEESEVKRMPQSGFEEWVPNQQSISTKTLAIFRDVQCEGETEIHRLLANMEKIWDKYLSSVSFSASDFLSLEHLGLLLRKLARKESNSILRKLHYGLRKGVPNLVVCPKVDLSKTVLTIYAFDQSQPFPQPDEILYCSEMTTLEEVEIFWRRAFCKDSGKIFCIVNADILDYDVSDKAESSLEKHLQLRKNDKIDYSLVVVCSTEREQSSRICAALDKYRRNCFSSLNKEKICLYVETKLLTTLQQKLVRPQKAKRFAEMSLESSATVVKSTENGNGKSLYIERRENDLKSKRIICNTISIPLFEKRINVDDVMENLLKHVLVPEKKEPRMIHIDLTPEVIEGVDYLIFHIIILGCLKNSTGLVWRKLDCDLYMIETTAKQTSENESLDLLPSMTCCSPIESLQIVERSSKVTQCQMFDLNIIRTEVFQRPFRYLLKHQNVNEGADASKREVSPKQCVETVLRQCGIRNPSWATLTHFVKFLNTQLADFEQSDFLKQELSSDLPGFSEFVLNFLIQMSRDFALPSIKISDETLYQMKRSTSFNQDDSEIEQYTLRRTWENSHHDFLFFNPDHNTMTFLGFEVEDEKNIRKSPRSEDLLGRKTMRKDLYDALIFNRVDLNEDYDSLPRDQKISKLCQVMGLEIVFDPDPTYELTKDNAKKILAIFMRFRSGIPVIVMGETGCGKTRLIKFMCSLQSPEGEDNQFENLMLMKVHSGVRKTDIVEMVKKAENLANWNFKRYGEKKYTVLFFDETNTTELIGLVKEIMCDGTVLGDKISPLLKIVAACNPYRKHSREYLEKLEHAGLGYHVEHGKTMDRIGRIAMRTLVYRVQPLPCSMLPLVWDFGHLHSKAEEVYIKKMTENFVTRKELSAWREYVKPLSRILSAAQSFMRLRKDESSFVSLRNVQRTLIVMHWFFTNGKSYLFRRMKENAPRTMDISDATIAIVLALGVCYHASLKDRGAFREKVSEKFKHGLRLRYGADQMLHIIERCQDIFIENVTVRHNIAKNRALRENIFMMVICIELRIPLFVIGKPGSSKSLAKSVVSVSMQGKTSQNPFFQQFKQVHMITFQCSPLSAPEGIIGTFDEAIKYQKTKDLNRHVAVVVLEEIGLAEDSPKLPLKTLHSLLENDSYGEEITSSKVSFIGISNWALDPAKMNRGIYVHIENPDLHELVSSAEELCSPKEVKIFLRPLFKPLALSYLQLLNKNVKKREFFGLRDFYSLLKMISSFVDKRREKPTWTILKHCIKRNFGGTPDNWNPENTFAANLNTISKMELPNENYPDCSPIGLIEACLQSESDNRFLLLLTETTSVVEVLQERFLRKMNPVFIFGSSFPKEEEYIQVCRNINRIKICMEAGATVVLLNLENLYESLYDALNQYYAYFGGNRFVDLGLGTQKVKCRVHRKFRLIVVAETEVVYSEFPIPLINRLEKHFLHMSAMLSDCQQKVAQDLLSWVKRFVKSPIQRPELQHCKGDDEVRDTFIGFNADTCAAATLQAYSQTRKTGGERMDNSFPNSGMESKEGFETEVLKCAQKLLLYSATPDGVLRSRSNFSTDEYMNIERIYFMEQKHEDFISFLGTLRSTGDMTFIQITTHSKLFSSSDKKTLCDGLKLLPDDLSILNLLAFDTENNFRRKVREKIKKISENKKVLIVQCDNGTENGNLITCTRFCLLDQIQQVQKYRKGELHIVLIIHIPQLSGGYFAGFQCQQWRSVHLDDIRQDESSIGGEGSNTFGMLTSFSKCQTPEEQESYNIEKRLNLPHLIEYTAHTALSRVWDSDTNRSKERIEEIFPLLKNADFVHGIGKHLVFLMKEREVACGQKIESWLYSDVTDKKYINKAGTFRKALNDCIREKLSPILAEIISLVDTNKNIRTLIKNPYPRSWKYKLWMEIANDPSATFMMYSKLTSSKFQDLGKALVVGTGVTGKIFDAVMPFSWIIFKSIGDVLQASKNTGSTSTTAVENVQRVSDILEKMPIGKILQSCLIAVNEPEYIEAYLQDFISMTYLAKCPEEERIVQTYIREKMKTFPNRRSTVEAIVSIHAIFDLYSCNLRNFSRLIQVWPTCTSVIARNMQTFHEELDILGLHLMLDHLEPGKNFSELDQRTKWQTDFHKFRGVIEDIIGQNISGKDTLELRKWRKCLVVDLFLQHCGSESSFGIKRVKVLWIMLRDKEDFKEVDGIKAVENFLTEVCMKQKIDELLGKGQVCQVCETSISEPPVHLQCNSIICQKCSNDMKLVESQECPSCHKKIPKGENHENQTINVKYQELQQFTRKINSFFIGLVSQLCFSEGSPPSRELIQKLMSYITLSNSKGATSRMITKQMSVFAGGIDPSPVLRSYLLQCLLKTNFEAVLEELQSFLTNGERLLESNGAKDVETMEQFFVLVINCFEDSFYQKVSQSGNRDDEELSIAIRFLKNAVNNAEPMTRDVKHLKCLAETKFGLSVAAKYLYDLFIFKTVRTSQSIEYLLEATESICTKSEAKQPLFFLIKILCRTFGYERYSKILEAGGARMRWFYVPELHFMNKECCDRFIVCGNWYTEIRDNILQAAITRNKAPLHKEIDSLKLPRFQKKICVLLAVFKEITMSNLYPVMIRRINNEGVEFVWQCLAHHSVFQQKRQYLKQLSENRLFQNHMTIQEGMAIGHQSLVCLLLHFFIVMTELPSQYPIILPLFNLIHNPQSMLNCYLPTMPQDDFEVVQEAILAQRQGLNENPVFYECPNGHRYMIGDCGRPDSLGTCPECHADIGGRDHKLHRGNILNAGGDQTSKGHILGDPENRKLEAVPERKLSSIECGFLRLFIHCSMYLGATFHAQDTGNIIKPRQDQRHLLLFLWRHMEKDLSVVRKSIGKSLDDLCFITQNLQGYHGKGMQSSCQPSTEKRYTGKQGRQATVGNRVFENILDASFAGGRSLFERHQWKTDHG